MSRHTYAMLCGVAAVACLSHAGARAEDAGTDARLRDLAQKIEQMRADYERQIDDLRQQQAKLGAEQAARPAAAPPSPDVVVKGELPGSFRIPGTNTSLKIGGYARLDVVKDFNGGESGAIGLPQTTPFGGSAASTRKGYFNENARQSRFYLRTLTQTDYGPVTAYLEGDFLGAGGSEGITNSSALRLRHAYVEAGPFLAGQTWTNLVDLASLPETLDFYGGNGPMQGVRAGQLRYTAKWAGGTQQFSVSAENPEADIFGTVTTVMSAASSPTNTQTLDTAPDITVKYALSGGWGRVTLGGLARHLVFNNTGGAALNGFTGADSVNTFAVVSQGRINTFGADSIQYAVASGDGVARYILGTVNNSSAAIVDNQLKGIHERALSVGYTRVWAPTWRSNLIWGQVDARLPHPAVAASNPSRVSAIYANLIWAPIPLSLVGLEFEHSEVRNDTVATAALSNRGSNNRLQASFQYGF